ncbi:MAG TPA: hypothetical protein PK685_02885 [archaeon]|jgi:hypothetical protein|nr:hypothetical protein [archaeon]
MDKNTVYLGITIVALVCAAVFLEGYIQEREISTTTTLGFLSVKPIIFYTRPDFSQANKCGNGFCEYEIGETPLSCPEDCPV